MKNNNDLKILYEWQSLNKLYFQRGKLWYLIFFIIVGLFLFFAIYDKNFLFAIIIILLTIIILSSHFQKAEIIEVALSKNFLVYNGKKIYYRDIQNFWISNLEDLLILNIALKHQLNDIQKIYLFDNANPLKIRKILLDHDVKENKTPPDTETIEKLVYLLKL